MKFLIGLFIGVFIEVILGVFIIALISVNKDKNDDEQETYIKSLKEDRNEF